MTSFRSGKANALTATPDDMRRAVAGYVEEIHRSYVAQALTFPPGVQGHMPLLSGTELTAIAVGVRHLHLMATLDRLGPPRGQEIAVPGEVSGVRWTLRFYDPVVLPALALIDESQGPAFDEIRHVLGVDTVVYHFTASPGAGLSAHAAAHVGTGLANGHCAVARDFETIRSRARGREPLVDEMSGAAAAGLIRAQALLAGAIAPRDPAVAALAESVAHGARPDVDGVRKALLASLGGREQWRPAS